MVLGFLLSVAGMIMPGRGKAVGGLAGAVGSVIFVPAGLICRIGCLRTRKKLRFAGFQSPAAAECADAASAERAVSVTPATDAPQPKAAGPAAQQEEPLGAAERRTALETPLVACEFADERPFGALMLLHGLGLGCYLLERRRGLSFCLLLIAEGVIVMIRSGRREKWKALALFKDRLECVPDIWSEPLSVPYGDMRAAEMRWNKACLLVRGPAGEKESILRFNSIPGRKRAQARELFAAKMRELNVLSKTENPEAEPPATRLFPLRSSPRRSRPQRGGFSRAPGKEDLRPPAARSTPPRRLRPPGRSPTKIPQACAASGPGFGKTSS